jgi:hypothetical protein
MTQLGFVLQLSRSDYGGPIFGALCISQPLLNLVNSQSLWGKGQYFCGIRGATLKTSCFSSVYLVYSNNVHYLRMRALQKLSTEWYRHDVISGNVAGYVAEGM